MVVTIAWPSLFLAQQDKAQREHTHHNNLFQQNSVTGTELGLDEVVDTVPLIIRTEDQSKDSETLSPLTAPTTKLISNFKNTSNPIINTPKSITTTTTVSNFPTITLYVGDDSATPSLIVGYDIVETKNSATIPAPLSLSQREDVISRTSLYSSPSPPHPLEFHANNILISTPSILSIYFNSSSLIISTPTRDTFATLLSTTSSLLTYSVEPTIYPIITTTVSALESAPPTPTSPITDSNVQKTDAPLSNGTIAGDRSNRQSPNTPVVIGSVMGSIAGIVTIIFLVIFFFRYQKNKRNFSLSNFNQPGITEFNHGTSVQPTGDLGQQKLQSSDLPIAVSSITSSKLLSQKANETASPIDMKSKGFHRISGRKIPSVIQFGGDGFGDDLPNQHSSNLASSCYDTQVFPKDSASSFMPNVIVTAPPRGINTLEQSSSSQHTTAESVLVNPVILKPPRQPDAVGRSRVSMDSSRASRFTEEV